MGISSRVKETGASKFLVPCNGDLQVVLQYDHLDCFLVALYFSAMDYFVENSVPPASLHFWGLWGLS